MSKFDDLKNEETFNTYMQSLFSRSNPENPKVVNEKQLFFLMNVIAQERDLEKLCEEDTKELMSLITKNSHSQSITIQQFKDYFKELI